MDLRNSNSELSRDEASRRESSTSSSAHQHGNRRGGSSVEENDLTNPLLLHQESRNSIRQRGIRWVDLETESVASAGESSRILDRSGAFGQSRGRWSVHRQSRQPTSHTNRFYWWLCCYRQGRVWNEWNLGGWFHRLAYQRTGILMLILFVVYTSIVVLFAAIYLTVSLLGETIQTNPDGSEKHIPFCHMEINNRMEALYLSLSTMASIGYGGELSAAAFVLATRRSFRHDAHVTCWLIFSTTSIQLLFW